ncbi:MAG: AmpG family muropeptide MFS transporter [Paludibacteraceae bacterium]|nr:AmpG family muropeptide MFS transporter [Paludibacteraceae bacterium]
MNNYKNPWSWIPTLYFAEGLPYVLVMTVSVIMYKNLGISNAEIAFYTSWLYLPWVIKPFWSPFVDLLKTKRWWITSMQLLIGAGLAGIAFFLPTTFFFQATLAVFWLMAFSSATHDIAADGFYMLALNESEQSLFVGIRNIFYRIATITGQGLLIVLAGMLEKWTGNIPYAWSLVFFVCAGLFIAIGLYHSYQLPKPTTDKGASLGSLGNLFKTFFQKKGIVLSLAFILLYRLGEAQLAKLASPFLLDKPEMGGLNLSTEQVGIIYGTIGVIALLIGGIVGGIVASKHGLKKWLWYMVAAMNVPNLVYVYLAFVQPENFWIISSCVAIEQLGYGFGFTAFMLYLIYVAQGPYQTAHYAICTGFMALGMMLPGMIAGWLQEMMGYDWFFIWVCLCTIPGIILAGFLPIPEDFGKKK